MAQTGTKSKMQQMLEEAEGVTKRKTAPKTQEATVSKTDEKFADIENNTFYKIIFSEAEPEEKKKLVTDALTYTEESTKEENQERLKEFTLFKEYMQHQRKLMAQEIIRMTDTGAFSELKAVIDDLNSGLLEFDKRMEPLTAIIDAVFELRKAGGETVLGVFQEIKDDQAAEEERKRLVSENEAKLQRLDGDIKSARVDIEMLSKRRLLGLLGPSKESQRQALMKQHELEEMGAEVTSTEQSLVDLRDPNKARETKYAHLAVQKAKLRELLDITSEQHKERQKMLVNAAQGFVVTTDERVNSVLQHLDGMSGQISNLSEANTGMQTIYAVLSEGSQDAAKSNQEKRAKYVAPAEGVTETMIEQMTRETRKAAIEDHITSLGNSTIETVKTYSDLATQGVRIKSMKDANREQVAKTRELHSSGVAGVADRLSTVLQAVSAAALNESSEAAKMSVNSMNDKTNAVVMQEAIRTAMGLKDVADGIERALGDLEDYKQGVGITTKIARENLQAIQDGMTAMREKTEEVKQALKEATEVGADIDLAGGTSKAVPAANDDAKAPSKAKAASEDPFKKLRMK